MSMLPPLSVAFVALKDEVVNETDPAMFEMYKDPPFAPLVVCVKVDVVIVTPPGLTPLM